MFILATNTWPGKYSTEVGKITIDSVKSNPLPDFLKRVGMYIVFGAEGLKSYALYDVDEGHEYEGYKDICNRFARFFPIEGFQTTIECLIPVEEGLNFVGLSM